MTRKLFSLFLTLCMCISMLSGLSIPNTLAASTPASVTLGDYSYNGSYIRTQLTFSDLSEDCVMYAAIYAESGIIKQINKYTFQKDSVEGITIRIPAPSLSETDIVKIFFFGASNGVKPLCKNLTFNPIQSRSKVNAILTNTNRTDFSLYPDEAEFLILNSNGLEGYVDHCLYRFKVADGININDYFGITADIYISTSGNMYEVTEIVPDGFTTVEHLDINAVDTYSTTDYEIAYYPSPTSAKTSSYRLSQAVEIYYNYSPSEARSVTELLNMAYDSYGSGDMELALIDNNGDSKIDIVMAYEYSYDIVDYIEPERDCFTGINQSFSFDFEDDDVEITIIAADGSPMSIADLKEGDAIAYMTDATRPIAGRYFWIEVINIGENFIEGTVDGVTSDSLYINNTEYYNISGAITSLGREGKFYLTRTGKIFYFEIVIKVEYAYILDAELTSSFEQAWNVRLLTKDNKIETYTLNNQVYYDDRYYSNPCSDASFPLRNISYDHTIEVENKVITFKTNPSGYITEINTANVSSGGYYGYRASSQKLREILEDNTVVFNIDPYNENAPFAAGIDVLIDDTDYYVYNVMNEIGYCDGVIITDGECSYTPPRTGCFRFSIRIYSEHRIFGKRFFAVLAGQSSHC